MPIEFKEMIAIYFYKKTASANEISKQELYWTALFPKTQYYELIFCIFWLRMRFVSDKDKRKA